MITQDQLREIAGATAYDRDGDKLGTIGQVYYDDDTDQPKWLTVRTGLFGTSENFVPVQGADVGGGRVTVAYDKARIKDAPRIDEDGHLSPEDEQQLYRHYDLDWTTDHTDHTDRADGTRHDRRDVVGDRDDDTRTTAGHDTSGPNTDDAMTRSEEQLRVGTETHETGRARLRKHVVTEQQTVTVPVSHEELRIEREPITEANAGDAHEGPAISEEEHEVTLHAERPVVGTETVPVERVRVGTETVRGTETVGGEVRKEEVEVEDPTATRERRA